MRKARPISIAILITLPITVALLITVLPSPLRTAGTLTNLITIGSGEYDTCALRQDGTIVCWGAFSDTWEPPQDETFIDILVRWLKLCGLRSDGSFICWDISDNIGQVTSIEGPTGIGHPDVERFLNRRFATVEIGESGKCAIRTEDGTAVCWSDHTTSPVPAPAGQRFTAIRSGGLYACAFDKEGSPICWNYYQDSPPSDELFAAFSRGPFSACVIRLEDGSPICWGLIAERAPPPQDETFTAISVGDGYACALREDGSPKCWGSYGYDEPGERASPPSDERFSAISSGRYHACGLRIRDGSPVCWGLPNSTYDTGQAYPPGGNGRR